MEEQLNELANSAAENNFIEFLIRFAINFVAIFIIVRCLYYPLRKNRDFLFTFFLFNIINFLICFLLSSAKLKLGFAFGLFAIFSILRYRTVTVPVREMGYFFISVTLGIINSLASVENYYALLFMANGIIMLMVYIIDFKVKITHENMKEIYYERIDLIHPDKREEMIQDLRNRTGLNIHRIEIGRIDFFKDIVRIYAFYNAHSNDSPTVAANESDED